MKGLKIQICNASMPSSIEKHQTPDHVSCVISIYASLDNFITCSSS